MARINDQKRHQAYSDGQQAGLADRTCACCEYQRGTIYYDDWMDGYEHGSIIRKHTAARVSASGGQ